MIEPEPLTAPPIGPRPRFIWIEERISELNAAIERYSEAQKPIPIEWDEEREWLLFEHNRSLREFRRVSRKGFTSSS